MKKIFKYIMSYMKPQDTATVGLTSFRVKRQNIMSAPKPKIKENSTLNFNLLHK